MHKQRSAERYSLPLIGLHWIIALIVIPMVTCSFFLEDLPQTFRPTAIMLHKSFGLTILILMIIRIGCLFRYGRPGLPAQMPRWEWLLARLVQIAMYFALIAMAMAGWIMSMLADHIPLWFGFLSLPLPGLTPNAVWADIFFQIHQIIAWILIVLIGLHVAGALKHAIIDRDDVMDSMLP